MDQVELNREVRKYGVSFENTLFELSIDGTKHVVSPRQLQVDPISDEPLSVNFLSYSPSNRFRIPIEYLNEEQCTDIKRGCYVINVNQFIECYCDGDIPRTLTIDLADAKLGDVFRTATLKFPPGVRPSINVPHDYVIGVISTE